MICMGRYCVLVGKNATLKLSILVKSKVAGSEFYPVEAVIAFKLDFTRPAYYSKNGLQKGLSVWMNLL